MTTSVSADAPLLRIEKNCWVELRYTLSDRTTGLVLDETDEPFGFVVGYATFPPKFEAALAGLARGQEFSIELSGDDSFGDPDDELILHVDASDLPADTEVGDLVEAEHPDGTTWPFRVSALDDTGGARLDGNHPAVGRDVLAKGTIESLRVATTEEIEQAARDFDDDLGLRDDLVSLSSISR